MGAATPQIIAWHVSWLRVVLYQEAASTFTYRKQFLGCNEVLGDQDDGDTAELCGQSNKVKTMLKMSKLPQGSLFPFGLIEQCAANISVFTYITAYMQEHSLWFKWRALRWLWQAFTTILLGTLLGTLFGMFSIASKSLGVCILWKNPQQHPMIIMVLHGEPFFKPNVPGLCGCKCSNSLCYVDPIPCGYISLRCECICEFWECSDDDVNLWSWP